MKGRPGEYLLVGAIVALALLAYGNSLPNDFIWDDARGIADNYLVKGLRHIPRLLVSDLYAGTGEPAGNYRPLLLITFAMDYALFGGPLPWAFRGVNLLLHAGASLLLFTVLRRLLGGGKQVPAMAALLFAVHPVHTEAVAVVMGRAELLAACLVLGAWLVHLQGRRGALPISMGLYFLALLSKETAAVFPILLAAGALLQGTPPRRVARDFLLFCVVFAVYVPLRLHALGGFTPPEGQVILRDMGLMDRIGILVPVLASYVVLSLFPVKLSLDYQFLAEPGAFSGLEVAMGGLLLLGAAGLLVAAWRRRSPYGLAPVLFLAPLLPVSNLIPLGEILGERLLYLPISGFCLLVALLARRLPKGPAWGIVGAIIIGYGALAFVRNGTLSDQGEVALYTLRHYPASYKAHADAGNLYRRQGDPESARRHYEMAIRLKPRFRIPRIGLGDLLLDEGRLAEAERHFRGLRDEFPEDPEIRVHLGQVLLEKGEREEARRLFREALESREFDPVPRTLLGSMAYFAGEKEEAARIYGEVLEYHPDHAEALQSLGAVLYELGEYEGAAAATRKAIRWGGPTPAAWTIVGACEIARGRDRRAREAFEEVLRLDPDPDSPPGVFNRARALDYLGRSEEAIGAYRKYLEMDEGTAKALREIAEERALALQQKR